MIGKWKLFNFKDFNKRMKHELLQTRIVNSSLHVIVLELCLSEQF